MSTTGASTGKGRGRGRLRLHSRRTAVASPGNEGAPAVPALVARLVAAIMRTPFPLACSISDCPRLPDRRRGSTLVTEMPSGNLQHGLVSLPGHLQLPKHCGSVAHQVKPRWADSSGVRKEL